MNFRVQVFDRAGKFQYAIGKLGDSAGAMFRPKAVSVDSEGDIYIVDAQWGVVQVFNRAGTIAVLLRRPGHARWRVPAAGGIVHRPRRSRFRGGFVQPPRAGVSIRRPEEAGAGRQPSEAREFCWPALTDSASAAATAAQAQMAGDVMGMHNLQPGQQIADHRRASGLLRLLPCSALRSEHAASGTRSSPPRPTRCTTATPQKNTGMQPVLGFDSNMCLSCHDGTVAVGATVAYGQVTTTRHR